MKDLTIELRPHGGIQQTDLGPVEVEHDQWMVFARTEYTGEKSIHVGYIGKKSGAPFNGIHSFRVLPDAAKTMLIEKVAEAIGSTSNDIVVFEPPAPIAPIEVLEEYDDDDIES